MAKGRTISHSWLTEMDSEALNLCEVLSSVIVRTIGAIGGDKSEFLNKYGKISHTRDGGMGLAGGKLQRDSLCTRGRTGKAPFSNRNLRWHPLIVADSSVDFARPIDRIEVEEEGDKATLTFVISDQGREIRYPAERAHEMPHRHVVLPKHWAPHVDVLRKWDGNQWTQNSCVIAAQEACDWSDAVESYAVLGVSVATAFYGADPCALLHELAEVLARETKKLNLRLPSENFPMGPKEMKAVPLCPVCGKLVSKRLSKFRTDQRPKTWNPAWSNSKRAEGDDDSMQILHVAPLIESAVRHNARNVRFGHRWCNIVMADHSLDETLDFIGHILSVHGRGKQ